MSKPDYDSSVKVKQEVIDRIKNMGMSKALAAAGGSESPEFKEGVKRMYGGNRLSSAKDVNMAKADTEASKSVKDFTSKPEPKSVPMPPSAPAAATRAVSNPKGTSVLGKPNAAAVNKVGKPIGDVLNAAKVTSDMNTRGAKKAVGGFWNKNVGHALKNAFNL